MLKDRVANPVRAGRNADVRALRRSADFAAGAGGEGEVGAAFAGGEGLERDCAGFVVGAGDAARCAGERDVSNGGAARERGQSALQEWRGFLGRGGLLGGDAERKDEDNKRYGKDKCAAHEASWE